MLAFTHLAERRPEVPDEEPDPIEHVRAQAKQNLGSQASEFRDTSADAREPVPREEEISLVPDVPGIEFNPERRTFRWTEDIHREEFRLRAAAGLVGKVGRGRLSAYLGVILLAEIDLAIKVGSTYQETAKAEPLEGATARPYRKIFASYSHRDAEIVRHYELFVETLGDKYIRDVRDLRAGEDWSEALSKLIKQADVFQLFWSTNAMCSEFVRREWEYALRLNRAHFIRPTYWEVPLPESIGPPRLPPEALKRLHFHRIDLPSGVQQVIKPGTETDEKPNSSHRPSTPQRVSEHRSAAGGSYQKSASRASPRCVIFLIDQSYSMNNGIAGTARPKIDAIATAINRFIADLITLCQKSDEEPRNDFEVGVIGYTTDRSDPPNAIVGPVLAGEKGTLNGRDLVSVSDLHNDPLATEERQKMVDDGAGCLLSTKVGLPVWYRRPPKGVMSGTPMCAALDYVRIFAAEWCANHPNGFPPVVIHLTDGEFDRRRSRALRRRTEIPGDGGRRAALLQLPHFGVSSERGGFSGQRACPWRRAGEDPLSDVKRAARQGARPG